jgi:hypothetical protein
MMNPSKASSFIGVLILFAGLAATRAVTADAGPSCEHVQGHLEETLVSSGCASPVPLCTVAQMFGKLKGEARFTASSIIATADTPTTTVVFVTGDTLVVDARLEGKRGSLNIKNAAAYRTTGEGDLADVQTIVGGTGDFAGASGSLRISGNFLAATGGSSSFEGTICVP